MPHSPSIVIVLPLYKDWESFLLLIQDLKVCFNDNPDTVQVVVVDDFSLTPMPSFTSYWHNGVEVVELVRNMGHQKAIAVGLAHAVNTYPSAKNYVIMDCDGEDKPEDVSRLLAEISGKPFGLCFAHRTKRIEGTMFRISYNLYKHSFRLLTGQHIGFGNFCCMNADVAKRLIHVSEIWLHFSSGVIKSRIPYSELPAERSRRYKGVSKMSFTSLVNHGLSAIAVYSEFVAVRITLLSIVLSLVPLAGIFVVIIMKEFTNLAIPGWASFVVLGFLILIMQFFSLGILLSFVILSAKTIKNINPSLVYRDYIFKIHNIK